MCVSGVGALGALSVRPVLSSPAHPPPRLQPLQPHPSPRSLFIFPPPFGMGVGASAEPESKARSEAPTPQLTSTAWSPNVVGEADVLAQPDARTKSGTPAPTILIGALLEAVGAAAEVGPKMISAAPTASTPGRTVASSSSSSLPDVASFASSSLPSPPSHPSPVVDDAPAEARKQAGPTSPRMCSITARVWVANGGTRRAAADAVERTTSKVQPEDAVQTRGDGSASRPTCAHSQSAGGSAACHVVAAPPPSPSGTR